MDMRLVGKLEQELTDVLGVTDTEVKAVDAMVKELLRFRVLHPKVFQASILMLVSTVLALGDAQTGTSAEDLTAKLERMIALQKEVGKLVQAAQDEMVKQIVDRLGIADEGDAPLPKEKVN